MGAAGVYIFLGVLLHNSTSGIPATGRNVKQRQFGVRPRNGRDELWMYWLNKEGKRMRRGGEGVAGWLDCSLFALLCVIPRDNVMKRPNCCGHCVFIGISFM